MEPIPTGIIGFAHGHVHAYCQQWKQHPEYGVHPIAAWDHDAERLAEHCVAHAIEAFTDLDHLLEREDIRAVVIATETSLHAEIVERAAASGKAIVLQKPLALTLEEADRIVAAVEKHGVPFTLAWQMRVDPQNIKMKKMIEEGGLGRICMVRRRHGLSTHVWPDFEKTWHVDPKLNRDIFADDAAHPFDFIYWLLGMPASVTAELGSLINPTVPNDNAIAVFRYSDGTFAEACCSFTTVTHENTTEVVAEKGTIIQNYGDAPSANGPRPEGAIGLKWCMQGDEQWTVSEIPSPENHVARLEGLAEPLGEFLQGKREPIATAYEGRDVLRMILACYESQNEGKRVSFE